MAGLSGKVNRAAAGMPQPPVTRQFVKPKSLWLPEYDQSSSGRTMYHGSDSDAISGPFVAGKRDSGWFGEGMYGSMYPEYASRWGKNVFSAPVPDVPLAEIWTDEGYRKMFFDDAAQRAHDAAGGHEGWVGDERAYSKAFRDALLSDGVQGVRVGIGGHPDAEIVLFDPDAAGVTLTPFSSRVLNGLTEQR